MTLKSDLQLYWHSSLQHQVLWLWSVICGNKKDMLPDATEKRLRKAKQRTHVPTQNMGNTFFHSQAHTLSLLLSCFQQTSFSLCHTPCCSSCGEHSRSSSNLKKNTCIQPKTKECTKLISSEIHDHTSAGQLTFICMFISPLMKREEPIASMVVTVGLLCM